MKDSIVGIRECPQEPASAMEFALILSLSQGQQTFGDLWPTANRAGGYEPMNHHAPGYRFTDRWLQKGRRKGSLKVERAGSRVLWRLTDDGRDQFMRTLADAHSKEDRP